MKGKEWQNQNNKEWRSSVHPSHSTKTENPNFIEIESSVLWKVYKPPLWFLRYLLFIFFRSVSNTLSKNLRTMGRECQCNLQPVAVLMPPRQIKMKCLEVRKAWSHGQRSWEARVAMKKPWASKLPCTPAQLPTELSKPKVSPGIPGTHPWT